MRSIRSIRDSPEADRDLDAARVAIPHGMSISDDGKRGYFVARAALRSADLTNPAVRADQRPAGLRPEPDPGARAQPAGALDQQALWKDGSDAQHTIPVKIGGKPYIIFVDEGGSGSGLASMAQFSGACAAGMPPFPWRASSTSATRPTRPSCRALTLEITSAEVCSLVLPDLVGPVDCSRTAATTAASTTSRTRRRWPAAISIPASACSTFAIPCRPKEIAYYNPAGTTTASPGSNHVRGGEWVAGGPDWCSAQVHLDASNGTLWTTCQDNGLLVLKFTNGVWPFPEARRRRGSKTRASAQGWGTGDEFAGAFFAGRFQAGNTPALRRRRP